MATTKITETQIQQSFVEWCWWQKDIRLRWIHAIPNGARVTIGTAKKLVNEGLKSGVADMFLPCPNDHWHGLYLEFKTKKGQLSTTQKDFRDWCKTARYDYQLVRSCDAAIVAVREYLSIENNKGAERCEGYFYSLLRAF